MAEFVNTFAEYLDQNQQANTGHPNEDDLLNPPPVMAAEGYHGILRDVVRIATRSSEASPVAVAANFIGTFSAMIGRGTYQHIGDGICHARPFFILVGRTGKARKGTSEFTVRRIFNSVEQILHEYYPPYPPLKIHEGGISSGEGLGHVIRDRSEDDEGENVGTDDKRLYIVEAEFAGAMAAANREKNTLSANIRKCWDGKTISPLVSKSMWTTSNPHIVISGHITSAELIARMTDVDALSGFLNRFVILHIVRPKLVALPKRTPDEDIERVSVHIAESVRFSGGIDVTAGNTSEVTLSPDAIKFWCEQYPALTAECDGLAGALLVRTEIYARMLAMVFSLLDKTNVIDVQHIRAALAWVNYWRDSVQYIFATLAAKAEAERLNEDSANVLEYIRQNQRCSRSDITIHFRNKMNGTKVTAALNHLMNAAPPLIFQKLLPRSDGKPGKSSSIFWAK